MIATILLSGVFAGGIAYIAYAIKKAPVIDDPDNILSNADIAINALSKDEKHSIDKMKMPVFDHTPSGIEREQLVKDSKLQKKFPDFPQITLQVKDIEEEIKKHKLKVISPPVSVNRNTRSVVVELNGEKVELMQVTGELPDPDPVN